MSNSENKNGGGRPVVILGVAAAVWVAALVFTFNVRTKCAELSKRDAENRRLMTQLAPTHDAVCAHLDFIARNGNSKTSALCKSNSVDSAIFAGAVESAGAESPPARLESVTITKAPGASDTLAVDAVFVKYGK